MKNVVYTKCLICGKNSFNFEFSGKDYYYHTNKDKTRDVFKCNNCGLEQIYPLPTIEEQQSFYPQNYYSYIGDVPEQQNKSFVNKIFQVIGGFLSKFSYDEKLELPTIDGKGKTFLDIGCGSGDNLEIMKNRGWIAKGFEINDSIEYKNDIYYGKSITDVNFNEAYDFIRCHHVFEHVYNPIEFLNKCKSILKEDGRLVICLPNVKCFSSNIYGKYAAERDIPRHLYGYNYKNIQTLFINNGFKIVHKNYQINYGLLLSLSRLIYDKYKKDLSKSVVLSKMFLAFEIISSIVKPTNSMGFILKK